MFSSAEKTNKNVTVATKQASGQAFFRKAGDDAFFGSKEQGSFFTGVQTKLTVSQPDDPYEKEADAVAEQVMRMPATTPSIAGNEQEKLQRQEDEEEVLQPKSIGTEISSIQCQGEEEEEMVQAKFNGPEISALQRQAEGDEEEVLQTKSIGTDISSIQCKGEEEEEMLQPKLYSSIQRACNGNCTEALSDGRNEESNSNIQAKHISLHRSDVIQRSGRGPPVSSIQFQSNLQSSKGGGSALPQTTQSFMEQRFQADFSGVKIHTGSRAEGLTSQIHAQAFAHGNDIYFNSGKFSPDTASGGTLLAHELTHTIQQGASKTQPASSASISPKRIQRAASVTNMPGTMVGRDQAISASTIVISGKACNPEISRQEDENDYNSEVQPKSELSSLRVDTNGSLHSANSSPTLQTTDNILPKEEEKKEDESNSSALPTLQKKHDVSLFCKETSCACENENIQTSVENTASNVFAENTFGHSTASNYQNTIAVHDRGPPVISRSPEEQVQRSVIDSALSAIGITGILDCVDVTSYDSTESCLKRKAQQVALNIPGYRALRVVLGNDPITGQVIERNGRNFIEAAFDIMPGGSSLHQKLDEQHQLDAAADWIDGKISRVKSIVNSLTSSFAAFWGGLGLSDLTSPLQVIRNGANIVLNFISDVIDFAIEVARDLLEMVKRFLLSLIVEFIQEQTTVYPLLRVILGKDPITGEVVDRNGTNILNALLDLAGEEGEMQRQQMIETGTFDRIVGYIDEGIAVFGGAYEEILAAFHNIWNEVSIENLMEPVATFQRIFAQFAAPIQRVLNFVIEVAAAILRFIKEVLMQRLSAWAREQRGYELVTVIIGKDPFTDAVVPRSVENIIRGFMSLMEGGREQFQQLQESGVIGRAVARINAAVARLNMTPASILQLFINLWDSFSLADLADPIAAFMRIIETFGEPIARLIAFVWQIVKIVVELILQAMNFPFDLINNIIARAMAAIENIKRDPVGFLKNLLRAIKQGFIQFFENILTHLMSGVIGWLMSELRDANVPIPQDFSLRGIITWVLEVLGISMEAIWRKLAEHPRIGPERVARLRGMIDTLEGIWTFIKDVQERGMAAIWEKIQEQLNNLWDTVLNAVKNWIMETIVNRVVARLLSMLDPTGIMAVINSAIAIYNAVQSFIRYLREMLEVINSFVNGVADIAAGNVTTAANYLERTMGQAMPIVIGFLANQVGLAGVGRRIAEIIASVREMVDNALTWLVDRAVNMGMDVLDRLMAMGRSAVGAVAGWLGIRRNFRSSDGEEHTLSFSGREANAEVIVSSTPMPVKTALRNMSGNVTDALRGTYNNAVELSSNIERLIRTVQRPDGSYNPADIDQINSLLTNLSSLMQSLMPLITPATTAGATSDSRIIVDEVFNVNNRKAKIIGTETIEQGVMVKYKLLKTRSQRTGNIEGMRIQNFISMLNNNQIWKVEERTKRDLYMGSTPRKSSGIGTDVKNRMERTGKFDRVNNRFLNSRDNQWYPESRAAMGHVIDAVIWWNSNGRFTSMQSDEVIRFMQDAENYELEETSQNSARGASLGIRYLPPAD